jgi:hypothetical protein
LNEAKSKRAGLAHEIGFFAPACMFAQFAVRLVKRCKQCFCKKLLGKSLTNMIWLLLLSVSFLLANHND